MSSYDTNIDRLKTEIIRHWLARGDGRFVSGCHFCEARAAETAELTPHTEDCVVRAILAEAVIRNV